MKQIFEILQEERDRILHIHESATKKQYLSITLNESYENIINEEKEITFTQSRENILLPMPTKRRLQQFRLPKNQIWKQNKKGAFTQKPGQGPVQFLCKGTKGKIENTTFDFNFYYSKNWFRSETLGKVMKKKFCSGSSTDSSNVTANQYTLKSDFGDEKIIPKGAKITPNKDSSEIMVGILYGLNQNMKFVCSTGKYTYGGIEYKANSDKLKYRLLKDYCKKKEESNNNSNNQLPQQTAGQSGTDGVSSVYKPNEMVLDQILSKINTPKKVDNPENKPFDNEWKG